MNLRLRFIKNDKMNDRDDYIIDALLNSAPKKDSKKSQMAKLSGRYAFWEEIVSVIRADRSKNDHSKKQVANIVMTMVSDLPVPERMEKSHSVLWPHFPIRQLSAHRLTVAAFSVTTVVLLSLIIGYLHTYNHIASYQGLYVGTTHLEKSYSESQSRIYVLSKNGAISTDMVTQPQFGTLQEAVAALPPSSTVMLKGDLAREIVRIDKPLRLENVGSAVRIGG